jgi:hypothetical protein
MRDLIRKILREEVDRKSLETKIHRWSGDSDAMKDIWAKLRTNSPLSDEEYKFAEEFFKDEIKKREPDGFLEKEIERETEMMHMMYRMIGFSSLLGGLSSAMKLGLIVPGEVHATDLAYRKEEDDEQ